MGSKGERKPPASTVEEGSIMSQFICIHARKCKYIGCPHHKHHELDYSCLNPCINHELDRRSYCIKVKNI